MALQRSAGRWKILKQVLGFLMRACTFFFVLLLSILSPLHSQDYAAVKPLWDELFKHWAAEDLPAAEAAATRLIEALEPVATDFSMGISANSALHNRASLRFSMGDYAGSEADLKRSVEQAGNIKPPDGLPAASIPQMMAMAHDRKRLSLRGLTNFYLASGDYERATEAFEQAQAILPLWKQQQKDSPTMGYQILAAEVSSFEGTFYRRTGDFAKATEAFLSRVEEIDAAWELVTKTFGGGDNEMANSMKMNYLRGRANVLMELAEVSSLLGKHEEAVGFCKQARESAADMLPLYEHWAANVQKTVPTMTDEAVAGTMNGVRTNTNYLLFERAAQVFRAAGEEKAALDLVKEGLNRRGEDFEQQRMLTLEYNVIRPEESFTLLGDLQAIVGEHDEAAVSYEKALELTASQYPEGHPAALRIMESQALLEAVKGNTEGAVAIAEKVRAGRMQNLENVLAFATESQRLAYRDSIDPWSLYASLELPGPLYETVIRTKGIVLDSILEDQGLAKNIDDPEVQKQILELQGKRRELMEALLGGASAGGDDSAALRTEVRELEAKISAGNGKVGKAREFLKTGVKDVADAIPQGATLIEFFRYNKYSKPGRSVPVYGAAVLESGGEPKMVKLDLAEKIEAGMELYGKAVRADVPDEEMEKFLKNLYASVWKSIEAVLPQKGGSLILAPDGALNFLSFATLLDDEGKFLAESYALSYVTSGRDFLRGDSPSKNNRMAIFANPDFQAPPEKGAKGQRGAAAAVSMRGVLGRIGLSPLPGTKAEEAALRKVIEGDWGWEFSSHVELEATEDIVNNLKSPGILHLATHGFYLPQTGKSDPLTRGQRYWAGSRSGGKKSTTPLEDTGDVVLDNPMYRSGIALTGAEATLQQWGAGNIPDTSNDGILTAGEMGQLDLENTWLVVLSACETGLGEARSGEGVLGMRRGLIQAGTQNLLLTLWPVADRETVLFMIDFYKQLDEGNVHPAAAAAGVQRAYLKAFREKQGLTAAVKLAGPFILSFQQ